MQTSKFHKPINDASNWDALENYAPCLKWLLIFPIVTCLLNYLLLQYIVHKLLSSMSVVAFCRPTARVTRWWAGRDDAILAGTTPSHANCLKTRRLPPVGCTHCWATLRLRIPLLKKI